MSKQETKESLNFIEEIVNNDVKSGKNNSKVITRFPPEPNGYLHIGHSKAIFLNFELANKYEGKCNLRFDDTNPVKEDVEYIDSIKDDIEWFGYKWEGDVKYASDYFDKLYDFAIDLINNGLAYVDDSSADEISSMRGTPSEPAKPSPYRERSIDENINLFNGMKNGDFKEGEKVLRAKIDLASPNMHMRDPVLYRIIHANHHRTGDKWCIYPTYDFAHGQSDYFEGITHSLCTLEFEVHRPLYDWLVEKLMINDYRPQQIEFNRLNLTYTVMSKRKLLQLVNEGKVTGWDDPRMPTISGLRRRGYSPESIKLFLSKIGYTKYEATIDIGLLEHAAREDLNKRAIRVNGVLDPIKLIITNYPKDKEEYLETTNNPEDESMGKRKIPFSREIYIEKNDFLIDAPKKFFRLSPGKEVRLKSAYIIKCEDFKLDEKNHEIKEIYCSYDPLTKSGMDASNKKVKGTLHWVSANHAVDAEVRLYDRLFMDEKPDGHKEKEFIEYINPDSCKILKAKVEPFLKTANTNAYFQFQRIGYFKFDKDSSEEYLVLNRTVTLRDSWSKISSKK